MYFRETSLKKELVDGLAKIKIESLTPIQEKTMLPILDNENIFIHSETGTGKTFCFLLPILNKLNCDSNDLQSIIVAPTHELSSQIVDNIRTLTKESGLPIKSLLLIGETPIKRQREKLKKKPHIVVGTPGRLLELIKLKKLKLHLLQSLVMDEADKLFSGKFFDTTNLIIRSALKSTQFIFASASVEKEGLNNIFDQCAGLKVIETKDQVINDQITHVYFEASEYEKNDVLRKFILSVNEEKSLVFVHKNRDAESLYDFLNEKGIKVGKIHGDDGKENRKKSLDAYKASKLNVLISSDVAARGLHIDNVQNVINYDVPSKKEPYLHRAGRTGRIDQKGHCISLVSRHELDYLRRIQEELDLNIYRVEMSEGKVVTFQS